MSNVRTFETGATRDAETGKFDFEGFLSGPALMAFAEYMHRHRYQSNGELRPSDNWQKGIPRDAYVKSMFRHFMDVWQLHRGYPAVRPENGAVQTMQEALCGLLFNVQGYLHEFLKAQAAVGDVLVGGEKLDDLAAPVEPDFRNLPPGTVVRLNDNNHEDIAGKLATILEVENQDEDFTNYNIDVDGDSDWYCDDNQIEALATLADEPVEVGDDMIDAALSVDLGDCQEALTRDEVRKILNAAVNAGLRTASGVAGTKITDAPEITDEMIEALRERCDSYLDYDEAREMLAAAVNAGLTVKVPQVTSAMIDAVSDHEVDSYDEPEQTAPVGTYLSRSEIRSALSAAFKTMGA